MTKAHDSAESFLINGIMHHGKTLRPGDCGEPSARNRCPFSAVETISLALRQGGVQWTSYQFSAGYARPCAFAP